ncbi:hypothetical protein FHR56_001789 [Xanthomonas sacchari]|uniref:hypothetical protein n=1 Tax=unclassified Xanthomonas TaxID=2643310 RepID=UPI00136CCC0A|nr:MULTISPECIES: hypothetical protein [unclassified Xanthomonas]MBB6366676.1 hypothetical protein [Xanthomonas sp. F10]
MRQNPTAVRFHADLDRLALELVKAFGLKFSSAPKEQGSPLAQQGLDSPLLRWLDFRMRYVEPYPRPVVLSDRFPKVDLPACAQAGLEALVRRFEQGEDVNPYQGRGLILRNDTSASDDQRHARTDLLFADWGILHFHLTTEPIPAGKYFSRPADYLAFCVVGGNGVGLLDVLQHPGKEGFADPHLFEVLASNWPEHLEQYRIKGAIPEQSLARTQDAISSLRVGGVTTMYTHGGAVYFPPGGGVTTASTAGNVTMALLRIQRLVDAMAELADDPDGQMHSVARTRGIQRPAFGLGVVETGLSIMELSSMETSSPLYFVLAPPEPGSKPSVWRDLNEAFVPPWAAQKLSPGGTA